MTVESSPAGEKAAPSRPEETIAARTGRRFNKLINRYRRWAVKTGFSRKYPFALTICAVLTGIITYGALSGFIQIGSDPANIFILLTFDLILLLLLSVLVISRVVRVWVERRKGSAGSRLHIRLVALFAAVAALPAIVLAVFSLLIFDLGIQAWFSDTVRVALDESNAVAEAYLKEHQQNIQADILSLATDINHEGAAAFGNQERLHQIINTYAVLRSLSEVVVFEASGQVLAKAGSSFILQYEKAPPPWAFEKANEGEVAVLTSDQGDRVRGLVRLDRIQDTYLYVGRFVDHRVLNHMEKSQAAVDTYVQLEGRRSEIQLTFAMVFVVVALLLVLAAVWFGLVFATNLARPISQMITASESVRDGDLSVRVDDSPRNDELGLLSRSFNRMTSQLQTQRNDLVEANRQLELRRRFTETVLAGVSAGVIGLDDKGHINLPNRSASELLSTRLEDFIAKPLGDAVPEMSALLDEAMEQPDRLAEAQIKLVRDGRHHTLLVRIAPEEEKDGVLGYVVTFDDVTDLVSAQRKAAWADVARRIAHEIKNPLTPIQLSAERLKRRYLKEITSDRETFEICTDTIVRQVSDIGRMVDEFSSFARMPQPLMKPHDLNKLCRESVVLQKSAFPQITFDLTAPETPVMAHCDGAMLGQVLTNLLKNAAESIEGREVKDKKTLEKGHIRIAVGFSQGPNGEHPEIVIEDNGRGFPEDSREKLTEPYVTTRDKGTGLGLAIVKKIMEDHSGRLILEDGRDGGARVRLILPQNEAAAS